MNNVKQIFIKFKYKLWIADIVVSMRLNVKEFKLDTSTMKEEIYHNRIFLDN